MTQEPDVDNVIRVRIRGLRLSRGWSLENLAARCRLSPSTLSRLETGNRRIALDQLVPIARALGTTLDALVESGDDADVVIRPQPGHRPGVTTWILSSDDGLYGKTVAKMRITAERPGGPSQLGVHPGRDWFTVLSGIAVLALGERTILVHPGEVAEFSPWSRTPSAPTRVPWRSSPSSTTTAGAPTCTAPIAHRTMPRIMPRITLRDNQSQGAQMNP